MPTLIDFEGKKALCPKLVPILVKAHVHEQNKKSKVLR